MEKRSKLIGWAINFLDDLGDGPIYRLDGNIYDDERFEDGTRVLTSRLKYIDFDKMEAETQNTIYTLE